MGGCLEEETENCVFIPDVVSGTVDIQFEELQDSLAGMRSKNELVSFLKKHPAISNNFFRRSEYPDDSAFINNLYKKFTNPAIDTLLDETRRVFGDLSELKRQFTEAFANIKYYYPDFVPPKIQTVISGIETDLLVTDSVIVVGLDFYLGRGAKYRPNFYQYLLRRYEPEDIVPSCLLIYGIDDRINKTDVKDKTVVADMIAYGKAFYFAKHMLPCVPDSIFIWYTKEEMEGARRNEDLVWERFLQDKILFSTSMIDKRNYLGERPFTSQVGEKCPGRIGQWIGWRIVKHYMNSHHDVTLQQLMSTSDAQTLFKESGYRPRRR